MTRPFRPSFPRRVGLSRKGQLGAALFSVGALLGCSGEEAAANDPLGSASPTDSVSSGPVGPARATGNDVPSSSSAPSMPVAPANPPPVASSLGPLSPPTPGQGGAPGLPQANAGAPNAAGGSPSDGGVPNVPVVPEPVVEPSMTPEPIVEPAMEPVAEPAMEPAVEPEPTDCTTPPTAPEMIGWANEGGGTTGGGNAQPQVVTSGQAFSDAISGTEARVIHVNGSFTGTFSVGSNKTIIGICGAELRGSVRMSGISNVIIRNLRIVGNNCSDSPEDCSSGSDAVGVNNGSHHIWFDHLDVSDGSDGNLDITNASDYVTISWTKFSYSSRRTDPDAGASGHRFSNLIAASDTDAGEYRITWHHNWWADNIDQRMPRSRFGQIHVFNNLFTSSGNSYCTNAGYQAELLVENNVYRGVNNPLSPDANGFMRSVGNVFENTTGNSNDNGGSVFTPPYSYSLDGASALPEKLMTEVGPH